MIQSTIFSTNDRTTLTIAFTCWDTQQQKRLIGDSKTRNHDCQQYILLFEVVTRWFWVTQTVFRPSVQALIALYFHSFDSLHYSAFNHYFSFVSAILFIFRPSPVHPSSFPLTWLLLFTSVTSYPSRILVIPLHSVTSTHDSLTTPTPA